jgi:WD40 repeat protein
MCLASLRSRSRPLTASAPCLFPLSPISLPPLPLPLFPPPPASPPLCVSLSFSLFPSLPFSLLTLPPSSPPSDVAVCGSDVFATCSRDKTVRVWREAIGSSGFSPGTVCIGHTSFVTALAYAPPGKPKTQNSTP